jgi:hypothetical protein
MNSEITTGVTSPETRTTIAYIEKLAQTDFYGAVRIKFESGRPVHILREESLIPERMTEYPRKTKIDVRRNQSSF